MHILKNTFTKQYELEVYNGWTERIGYVTNTEKYIFKKHLKNHTSKTIEAGTGGGRIAFYLENEMAFKNIVAFDLVPKLIESCQKRAKEWNSEIKFVTADVLSLNGFNNYLFDNILYTGQVLSMLPKENLQKSLLEANKLGDENSCYVFSFMDWSSRWFNPILSFIINLVRALKFQKPSIYYIPEVRHNGVFNKRFFNNNEHSILWIKEKHARKMIVDSGFIIKSFYIESKFSKYKRGSGIFFICSRVIKKTN